MIVAEILTIEHSDLGSRLLQTDVRFQAAKSLARAKDPSIEAEGRTIAKV